MRTLLTLGFILTIFASQAVWVTFSPVLTLISEELNVPVEMLGMLAVMYPIFFLFLTIPSGLLLDRNFKRWFLFGVVATFFAASGRVISTLLVDIFLPAFWCHRTTIPAERICSILCSIL